MPPTLSSVDGKKGEVTSFPKMPPASKKASSKSSSASLAAGKIFLLKQVAGPSDVKVLFTAAKSAAALPAASKGGGYGG